MKKGVMKYLQYAVVLVVVVILLCGIFSILRRLTGTSSTDDLSAGSAEAQTEANIDEKADNSVPMTELSVTAPATSIRVGETMQLDVSFAPENATCAMYFSTSSAVMPMPLSENCSVPAALSTTTSMR